jgi:predicted phosphoadenosine phosphosulfate sulfurtransferase
LADADDWNKLVQRCSGINRGRLYSFEEIEKSAFAKATADKLKRAKNGGKM